MNIKDSTKKKISNGLFAIVVFISMSFIKPLYSASVELKIRMCDDFQGFGMELENLNEQISQILKMNTYNKEKQLINKQIEFDFFKSNSNPLRLSKGMRNDGYLIMYSGVSEAIKNILSDGIISAEEKKYLESLYAYNDELIKEYKSIRGDKYKDHDKEKELEKNIVKIYNNFSKKSEELLDTEKYSFMKEYSGDFSGEIFNGVDFETAKKYCEETFSKLVKNQPLHQDNSSTKNRKTYTFNTKSPSADSAKDGNSIQNIIMEEGYNVEFDKKTKKVSIRASGFTIPDQECKEQQLDNTAKEIVGKFSNNLFRYDKKINYEKDNKKHDKITSIEYSYIEEINGIYDEMKKIQIDLECNGLINNFQIVYPSDEKVIAPTISKEQVLSKIEKDSEIIDVLTIRNIEGKTEYEVHIKYKNTVYAAVFDGQNGQLKYYGKDVRNYKIP